MATIERGGQVVHFEVSGPADEEGSTSARTVVLGHSFLCSGEMWGPQVPSLAETHRVVNVDYRGHGRSGPIAAPVSLYDLVRDTVAILDELGIERAVWAGLSVGGMVAVRAALVVPDRVEGLILVDAHAGAERSLVKWKYRAMGLGCRLLGIKPLVPAVLPLMFGRTTRSGNPELVAEWKARFEVVDLPSILRFLDSLVARDSVEGRLGEIEVPTLVMVGDEDETLPPRLSRRIQAGIRGSTLETITGSGHLAALEQPEQVTGAMLAFLAGLSS